MTPDELEQWRVREGFTAVEATRLLGVSRNRWRRMRQGQVPIPAHITLACVALTHWGDDVTAADVWRGLMAAEIG